jgi:hypothetical protein
MTINNLAVNRSVTETLRLLESFQNVAKHGVLCLVDWEPVITTSDAVNTTSSTVTGSYNKRLADLEKALGLSPHIERDAKRKSAVGSTAATLTPIPSFGAIASSKRLCSASTMRIMKPSEDNSDDAGLKMTHDLSVKLRDDVEKERVKDSSPAEANHTHTPTRPIERLPRRSRVDLPLNHALSAPACMGIHSDTRSPSPTEPYVGGRLDNPETNSNNR